MATYIEKEALLDELHDVARHYGETHSEEESENFIDGFMLATSCVIQADRVIPKAVYLDKETLIDDLLELSLCYKEAGPEFMDGFSAAISHICSTPAAIKGE